MGRPRPHFAGPAGIGKRSTSLTSVTSNVSWDTIVASMQITMLVEEQEEVKEDKQKHSKALLSRTSLFIEKINKRSKYIYREI